ncbi:unnamed protein product [Leptosia nina]|uniref:Uncharacterized protein n=1 Tax=Leptosia nina TaxID=320188 RepID=A0AAV1JJ07_9NEOP
MYRSWCAVWVLQILLSLAHGSLLPLDVERLRASVGGYAVMNCHLDFPFGNEIPYHLQWDKDGEEIFSWYSGDAAPQLADRWGGRVRRVGPGAGEDGHEMGALALGGGAINVSSVRETDAGLYRCLVAFPNRTPPSRNNGTFYYLDVDGGNLIVTPPINRTVIEGESVELECTPRSPEWIVAWFREGESVHSLPALATRATLAPNGSLVLNRALATDLGHYECRVSTADGQRQSASAHLDVHYKAKVVYSPKERYLGYGQPASLDCHFSANPPLTNLRWEKDGFLFDPYNVPGVFYSRNGSLLFNKALLDPALGYDCEYNVRLNFLCARGRSTWRACPAQLHCPVSQAPVMLNRQLLPGPVRMEIPCLKDGTRSRGGNLTISSVREEDRGVYVCSLSNAAGSVRAETEVLVEDAPPRAPHGLTARARSTTVHISWQPGASAPPGGDIEYTVWYRERDDSEWRTMRVLTRGATDATVLGLRPATQYELRVLSQDQLGDGLFSKPIFVITPEVDTNEGHTVVATAAVVTTDVTEASTESEENAGEAAWGEGVTPGAVAVEGGAAELEVRIRVVEEGALVRWSPHIGGRCTLRWYKDQQAEMLDRQLLSVLHTHHDHLLVSDLEEGTTYWAQVQCGAAWGGAATSTPHTGRLRGAALGAALGALLLAAAAAGACFLRRRLRRRTAPPDHKRSR